MPLGGLRLTGLCAASKLFFAASQKAFLQFRELQRLSAPASEVADSTWLATRFYG